MTVTMCVHEQEERRICLNGLKREACMSGCVNTPLYIKTIICRDVVIKFFWPLIRVI